MQDAQAKFSRGKHTTQQPVGDAVRWRRPDPGVIKINVDGSFGHLTNTATCGGVLGDDRGDFICGFMFKCQDGDSVIAELCGCLHGLKLAWDLSLESDLVEGVQLLLDETLETHADGEIITEAKNLLRRDWDVEVKHICRWTNKAAYWLAKECLSALTGFHIVHQAPAELGRIIEMDKG